ncbi:MAG: hypothetical protein IH886_10305 [Nitrospinae bacterium]|nr:hypothetical protein [Nitrospinota bacterium]
MFSRTNPSRFTFLSLLLGIFILSFYDSAFAVTYYCEATKKVNSEIEYSEEKIKKYKYANKLEDMGDKAFISRCSFTLSAKKVTCDRYEVDHIERSPIWNMETKKDDKFIKKYYYFYGQLDFQLFPDLSFVENNGRGGIAFGKCRVISP